jgi:hypothetical protein
MDNLAAVFTSLESQRLRLRRFDEADLAPFLDYLNDSLVARYQTWESYTEQFRVCRGSGLPSRLN